MKLQRCNISSTTKMGPQWEDYSPPFGDSHQLVIEAPEVKPTAIHRFELYKKMLSQNNKWCTTLCVALIAF